MIRRQPSVWPRRLRRALGPLAASAAVASILLTAAPGAPAGQPSTGRAAGLRPTEPRMTRPAPPPAIAKTFRAVGGPVTATISVAGAPTCQVDLMGADGTVLAGGVVAGAPLTLHALAVVDAPISVVLRPSRPAVTWQVELTGAEAELAP